MSNSSQNCNDFYDIEDVEELRVSKEDMMDEIRENSKVKEKEGDVSGDDMADLNCNELGNEEKIGNEKVDNSVNNGIKGVFGIGTKGMEHGDSDADTEKENERMQATNAGTPITNVYNHHTNNVFDASKKSYANSLAGGMNSNNNDLFLIPTVMNNNGEKVVIFDEELVKEVSEKWKFIVCGYLVGYKMGINELRYNIRRMWGRYGLKVSVVDADGMCYFKFKNKEGMNSVIDQSLWLFNIPLKAWSVKGISALTRRLGRPIKMDQMTVDMCREGSGRLGYARVLVEINVEDEFLDKIKINYVDGMMKVKSTK
ncbi:RNA-directed DNA polymerase, eukaryota, reverse transcriptase zinc-binding domain protein [Tanacetum coccineum]